ncbi:MAG TPA: hypothetical protein VNW50_20590 [Streptosporangiaceae bacterium]|jgi:hypothetical protein|nr:hypothetical protein [Streptosporangiaceae bacterium]
MSNRKVTRPIMVAAAVLAIGGGSYGVVSALSGGGSSAPGRGSPAGLGSGRGSNARSGPAAGGTSGTVAGMSSSGFTVTTSAGQKVTINEASATKYLNGTRSASASAVAAGDSVVVLGTTDSTMITATEVIVQPAGSAATSAAASVVPFQRGARTTAKQAGQIPAGYTEGQGTIVSGTAANKATEAALAAYPGGVVDRVVQLSNGEYEVHNIGVNWPHHVFVSKDYKVVGAD